MYFILMAILLIQDLQKRQKNIEQWEKFREELKHRNRFLPNNALNIEQLEPFAKYIGVILKKGEQKFYRARINSTRKPFNITKWANHPKYLFLMGELIQLAFPTYMWLHQLKQL